MHLAFLLVSLAVAGPAGPADPALPPPITYQGAPPPTAAEVADWDAARYNDFLVAGQLAFIRAMNEHTRAFFRSSRTTADFNVLLNQTRAALREGRANAARVPPFRGDAGMRDALLDTYDGIERVWAEDILRFVALVQKEAPRNADLAAAEALWTRIRDELDRLDTNRLDAQFAFARAQGLTLVRLEPDTEEELPDLQVPGFPPPGSNLTASVHIGFAVGYYNAMMARQDAIVGALNTVAAVSDGDADSLERARVRAVTTVRAELRALRAAEAWQGDDGLRAGALAYGEGAEVLLSEAFAEYTQILANPRRTQADADRGNALIRTFNDRLQELSAGYAAAEAAYRARWAMDAYAAWQASLSGEAHAP